MTTVLLIRVKEFAKELWDFKVEFPYRAELTEEGYAIVPDEDGDHSEYNLSNFIIDEDSE